MRLPYFSSLQLTTSVVIKEIVFFFSGITATMATNSLENDYSINRLASHRVRNPIHTLFSLIAVLRIALAMQRKKAKQNKKQ